MDCGGGDVCSHAWFGLKNSIKLPSWHTQLSFFLRGSMLNCAIVVLLFVDNLVFRRLMNHVDIAAVLSWKLEMELYSVLRNLIKILGGEKTTVLL